MGMVHMLTIGWLLSASSLESNAHECAIGYLASSYASFNLDPAGYGKARNSDNVVFLESSSLRKMPQIQWLSFFSFLFFFKVHVDG